MPLIDHLLVLGFVVVWPAVALRGYRRFLRDVAAGVRGVRARVYLQTIAEQWILTAAVLAWWLHEQRALGDLGLRFGATGQSIAGALLTAVVLALFLQQWRKIRGLGAQRLAKIEASLGDAAPLLPTSDSESRIFRVLALTAGTCEEILFRGYLTWYLGAAMGRWPAMLVGAALFGLAHGYQGAKATLKTGLGGMVLGALYLATGSLFWPMALHAAMDLQGGGIGRLIHKQRTAA